MTAANRAALYLRRSAVDESGDDTSIKYQRRACEALVVGSS